MLSLFKFIFNSPNTNLKTGLSSVHHQSHQFKEQMKETTTQLKNNINSILYTSKSRENIHLKNQHTIKT